MERMMVLRSICRAACFRSSRFSAIAVAATNHNHHLGFRNLYSISSLSAPNPPTNFPSGGRSSLRLGSTRYFSDDVSHMPVITDTEIRNVFKDLMAASWDELPYSVVQDAKKALSKNTDDKAGQEALKNVFRAAESVEEFGGILISMKMELDDSIGMSGENVKPLSSDFSAALKTVFQKYATYLDAFGSDEIYLKKKVETDLGSKMIYLKMRCGHLGAEWGKITVLGTSGLSGSYVEQRA
ncbi:Succinate dehydrogenase subunit 5 [Hibiscus syriacus]|uniref:Succinate dehydrogenase subunit 5 n=1 Tax=Hibiscus syriacus TaxID=106335 RepID=A0A6A2ZY53_HIBSY|nr:succinate dehydrogenase subunit 5, mitochondrial-like [Hibiscus syriacus]KAE8695815.1 Succinate dehydrogenase subunit 5 [Hibiscus syriacus]